MYIAGSKNTIDTGDTYFQEISKLPNSGSVEAKRKLERQRIKKLEVYDGKPLEARIEYSRFIVDCPNCSGAEFFFEDKLFVCSQCKNSDIEGRSRKVKPPNNRKEIEAVLVKRPIKNRHWFPDETLEDLKVENLKMGVTI